MKSVIYTVVYDRYGNEIDRIIGHVEISGRMYEKHLPIRIEYISVIIEGTTTIEKGGEE